jgi:hypothetical protein
VPILERALQEQERSAETRIPTEKITR